MTDIKRLHKVHKNYPNNYRREGKTTYCFDSLLRCAQTGYYKHLCYVTSTERASQQASKDFREFLIDNEQWFLMESKDLTVNGCKIIFSTFAREDGGRLCRYDGYILDSFEEDRITPQWKLDEIEDWSRRQLTRLVYR